MPLELDHVFVYTSAGAPEAGRLVELGLTEGKSNRHPGQGSANRRFFFRNAMLELLWVEDAAEAQSEVVRPLGLWERWSGRRSGACPLGLCLRPQQADDEPPFPTWDYRPPYLPAPLVMRVGVNSASAAEPLVLCMPFGLRPGPPPAWLAQAQEHPLGLLQMTALRIFGPWAAAPSAVMLAAQRIEGVALGRAEEHLMEVGFDGERQGRRSDLRPELPLVICW
jgi:hypothetical protein